MISERLLSKISDTHGQGRPTADLWQILPAGPRAAEVVHTSYLRPGLSEAERATMTEMAPWICETVVDGEDFWVAGRTEPGGAGRSPGHRGVRAQRAGAAAPAPGLRGGASGCRRTAGRSDRRVARPVRFPAGRHAGPVGRYMTVGERLAITM